MNSSTLVGERRAAQIDLRLVLLLGALGSFAPLSLDTPVPALPTMANAFGVGTVEMQLTMSACLLGFAFGQVLAGPLNDVLGRRRPMLIGIAVYVIVSLLCTIAPSAGVLIALRLVQGASGAFAVVIASAVVRDLYAGSDAARFFSLMLLVSGSVPVLAPIVGGQLLQVASWPAIFLMLSVISLIILLLVARNLRETLPPNARQRGGLPATLATFQQLLRDRVFVGYALAFGLVLGAVMAYVSGATFALQQIYRVSPQDFSLIYSVNSFGFLVAGQINGWLVRRIPPRRLLIGGLTSMAISGLVLIAAVLTNTGLPGMLPAMFVLVSSMGFVMPNMMSLALSGYPQSAGSAAALLGFLPFVCGSTLHRWPGSVAQLPPSRWRW